MAVSYTSAIMVGPFLHANNVLGLPVEGNVRLRTGAALLMSLGGLSRRHSNLRVAHPLAKQTSGVPELCVCHRVAVIGLLF